MTDLSKLSDDELVAMHRQMRAPQVGDSLRDSPIGGYVRGLRDPIDAGAQMLVHALPQGVVDFGDAVGNKLADWGLPVARTNHAPTLSGLVTGQQGRTVDDINREAEAAYQGDWRRGQMGDEIDTGRLGGNIAAAIALTRGLPVGAPTLAGRMTQGAVVGGAQGALAPVQVPREGMTGADFWMAKGQQAGSGAAFGAAGAPVIEGAGKVAGAIVEKIRPRSPVIAGTAQTRANDLLRQAGVDATATTPELAGLRAEVVKALESGAKVDPAALSRIADARSVGVTLTRGQATRDPRQYTTEQDLRNLRGGERLQQRFAEQNQQLVGGINAMGPGGSAYQSGTRVVDALRQSDTAARKGITEAYDAARGMAGTATDVPMQPLAQRLGEVLDTYGHENVPGVVQRHLKQFGLLDGEQSKVFTIADADKLRKLISANSDGATKTQIAALTTLRKGVDEAEALLADQGSRIGADAAKAFEKARGLARSHYQTVEQIDALRAAIDGAAPDKFVRQHVIAAPVGQVRMLKAFLQKGSPELVDELRGQVVSYLKQGAVGNAADEMARFSQAGFRKALGDVGDDRLRVLFTPAEVNKLKALSRTASAIQARPAASAVNESNTGQAVINALGRLSGVPYIGAVARPLQTAARESRATSALSPSFNAAPVQTPQEVRRALERTTLWGGVGGGLLGAALTQPR